MPLTKQQVVDVIRSSPFGKWTEELAIKLRQETPSNKSTDGKNAKQPP